MSLADEMATVFVLIQESKLYIYSKPDQDENTQHKHRQEQGKIKSMKAQLAQLLAQP